MTPGRAFPTTSGRESSTASTGPANRVAARASAWPSPTRSSGRRTAAGESRGRPGGGPRGGAGWRRPDGGQLGAGLQRVTVSKETVAQSAGMNAERASTPTSAPIVDIVVPPYNEAHK